MGNVFRLPNKQKGKGALNESNPVNKEMTVIESSHSKPI